MAARVVIHWPNPSLLKTSEEVLVFDEALASLAEDLYHTMLVSHGAGIAAPQVGINKNICVISKDYVPSLQVESFRDIDSVVVLVNPTIEFLSEEKFTWEEACLSVPDLKAKVERINLIKLSYTSLSGESKSVVLEGVESATVQHEVDHLVGKLFIHRLKGVTRQTVMRKLRRKILNQKRVRKKPAKNSQSKVSEEVRIANRKKRKKKQKLVKANRKK